MLKIGIGAQLSKKRGVKLFRGFVTEELCAEPCGLIARAIAVAVPKAKSKDKP